MAGGVQDLIEGQISEGGIGGGVSLPKGVFEIDDTLTIASVRGLRFGGQSPWATELRWVGPADRPMFDIDRSADILLEHFSITVGAGRELLAAAWIQNGKGRTGPKAAPGAQSSHVSWNNIRVVGDGNLVGGFHVKLFDAEKDIKNDHHSLDHVTVSGYTGTAFTLQGRNAKNLGFDRCHCLGLLRRRRIGQYAVDTSTHPNQGGAFVWNKGSALGHEQADFKIGDRNDTIKIDGVSSEKSARILQMPDYGPGAETACPVLLENYRFGTGDPANPAAPDGEVIQCEAAGPLSIIACKIGSGINRQQLRIRYAPRPKPGAFNFIGNAIGNDGDGHIFTASDPTMPYKEGNLGYRQGAWRPLPYGVTPWVGQRAGDELAVPAQQRLRLDREAQPRPPGKCAPPGPRAAHDRGVSCGRRVCRFRIASSLRSTRISSSFDPARARKQPVGCTNSVGRCTRGPGGGFAESAVASAIPSRRLPVLVSFVYVVACRLFALVLMLARSDRSMELEILVLRHELSVLRRQARRPQLRESDRLLLAALSRVMPRRSWQAFLVTPETLVRWHRRIVAHRWTTGTGGRAGRRSTGSCAT